MDGINAEMKYFVMRQTFPGWEVPVRYISEYELVFVVKGEGLVCIEDKVSVVKTGDLIFFRPGVKHSLWVEKEPYACFYAMHFTVSGEKEPLPFPDLMHPASPMRLETLFRRLNEAHLENGYLYRWRETLLLGEILLEVFTFLHEDEEPGAHMRIRRTLKELHNRPLAELSPSMLMEVSGMGKTAFFHAFRSLMGTTPVQYIIALRLESARDLLENTDLPVSKISEICGFSDPLYFSRRFRARFLTSPREYRKNRKRRG